MFVRQEIAQFLHTPPTEVYWGQTMYDHAQKKLLYTSGHLATAWIYMKTWCQALLETLGCIYI